MIREKMGQPPFFFSFLFFKCLDKIGAWKKYIVLIAEKKFRRVGSFARNAESVFWE